MMMHDLPIEYRVIQGDRCIFYLLGSVWTSGWKSELDVVFIVP